jgi:FAD/FMN-containing dehydrogenase
MTVYDGPEVASGAPGIIPGFVGDIVRQEDSGYDRARAIWNAMHDRRPALIARCTSPQDVAAAIRYGRDHALPIAVRGGGHSLPGHSVCDGGIVVDLRRMNDVHVDPVRRRARVGGGALLSEVDSVTQQHGLVVPAGTVSHTGIGGLALGGGVGRLMRRFGLTIDNLIAAEVVTADSRILRASATENSDLFWAIRGGGGNFGVVTAFELALHELSALLVLAMFHRPDDARTVLDRACQTMRANPPDELYWTSFLRKAPPLPWVPSDLVGAPGIVTQIEWSGNRREGQTVLQHLQRDLAPAVWWLDVVPYVHIQAMTDQIFAHGQRCYIKAGCVRDLTDGVIEALIGHGSRVSSPASQIEVVAMGGAIRRVAPEATAFPHRDAAWLLNIPAIWEMAADDEEEIRWVRSAFGALEPHVTGGKYVNFMDEDEDAEVSAAYGRILGRLQRVKRRYDPDNVLRLNQNITPR